MSLFGPTQEEKDRAFEEGRQERLNEGFVDSLIHGVGDIVAPGNFGELHEEHERGYHHDK